MLHIHIYVCVHIIYTYLSCTMASWALLLRFSSHCLTNFGGPGRPGCIYEDAAWEQFGTTYQHGCLGNFSHRSPCHAGQLVRKFAVLGRVMATAVVMVVVVVAVIVAPIV